MEILKNEGFELIESHISELIEKIKLLAIKKARNEVDKNEIKINLSTYLSEKLHFEYTYLSSIFSAAGEMTLSEIALVLDYSSTAYLSTQFKK